MTLKSRPASQKFLSTLSLRRATLRVMRSGNAKSISIHALLAESDPEAVPCGPDADISIHALLAESDTAAPTGALIRCIFLSTLSLRRATLIALFDFPIVPVISIHALLAESDRGGHISKARSKHFYPRSPCGERRKPKALKSRLCVFLSTLSLRRATGFCRITAEK